MERRKRRSFTPEFRAEAVRLVREGSKSLPQVAIDRHLVLNALDMALKGRQPPRGLLHHPDRGSQYASTDYQQVLAARGIQCSMSRKGNCWDGGGGQVGLAHPGHGAPRGRAGLRSGERIALEWPDIDFRRGQLHIRQSEWRGHVTVPKGGRDRRVPMTKRLAALLAANRHLRGARVLYRNDGEPVARATVSRWMKKAQTRAGLPVTGALHILRHTFCSWLAMRGTPAKAIQELAGHESLTTTQRYMHLSPAAKDAAISLLDTAGVQHFGDILETGSARRRGRRGGRKGEGPGIVEVSLWIPGPSIGEEYGT